MITPPPHRPPPTSAPRLLLTAMGALKCCSRWESFPGWTRHPFLPRPPNPGEQPTAPGNSDVSDLGAPSTGETGM